MKYNNHLNYRDRKRLLIKLRILFVFLALVLAGIVVYFYVDYLRDQSLNTEESATSEITTSIVAPSVNIFKTPYYQFQTDKSWVEVPNESSSNKFVYRSLRSNLIEHELVVYVDQIPANIESNRVLPISFNEQRTEVVPTTISEHCIKALNGQSTVNRANILFNKVRFNCDSDSTNYTVLVGEINDDTAITMTRPDGSTTAYTIYYANLRANQDATKLVEIIDTFQTR